MKKTFLPLSVCFLMCLSIQVLAQNDSARTGPTTKVLSNTIQKSNDTLLIGNMLIVKKQGNQSDKEILNRKTLNKPYGTTIRITNSRIAKTLLR